MVTCRDWPVVGNGYAADDLVAVVSGNRVVAASHAARRLGVAAGLRRREAQRRAPGLTVVAPDPAAEGRLFEPVLRALDDITPRIEIEHPGRCSFLTRGPSRYFGGDTAMSQEVVDLVGEILQDRTSVHVGTADGRFGALWAANDAPPNDFDVVQPGDSPVFLAGLPVTLIAADVSDDDSPAQRSSLTDLVDVLQRLGLLTLGDFAALDASDVVARFGTVGARAHLWANGYDDRPAAPCEVMPELEATIELDPPVQRVDQAAFVAKVLADEFIAKLRDRGASCARVAILAETEHGEQQQRVWRANEAFSAIAISERMRWQLDGWLSAPQRQRPTGGLVRLVLRPDDLSVAAGRQLGFWGEETGLAERAARAVARVQGLAGVGTAFVPEVQGGRSPDQAVVAVPAESVDLVERSTSAERAFIGGPHVGDARASAVLGVVHPDASEGDEWSGTLPAPAPTRLQTPPTSVQLLDSERNPVEVSSRGLINADPAWLRTDRQGDYEVVAWSGPWLLDERWWHVDRRRRRARMQVVLGDGRALLVSCERGAWAVEAVWD